MFFVAFRIPNLLRELFAEGSMSAALIPVLTDYESKDPAQAKSLVRSIFTVALIIVGMACALGIIFAPFVVSIIAPGFVGDADKFSKTVDLTRIMMPFLLFISMAAITMGALNTRRIFFIPALAPAFLNIVIISSMILLSGIATSLYAVAFGVLIGGCVQFLIQIPSFKREGFGFFPHGPISHPGLTRIGLLIIPATFAMAISQINILISSILASYLAEGSITYLAYSMHLIQFPIGIFGVAMGMAVLPSLSMHAAKGDMDNLRSDFSFALRLLFFIAVPSMIGLIALRTPIINLLFQHGRFDYSATKGTADALIFYSLGIWAIVGVRIVAAGFYAMQDTKTPVKTAAVSLCANILFSLLLMYPLRHMGLALANSMAASVNFMLLFYLLRRKLGRVDARRIIKSLAKTLIAAAPMGLFGAWLLRAQMWESSGNNLLKAVYLSGTIAICVALYALISMMVKSEELQFVIDSLRRRYSGDKGGSGEHGG